MAREALIERNTKETQIRLQLNIDGTGSSDIDTGIGFFDHMLNGYMSNYEPNGVKVTKIVEDPSDLRLVYEPDNPDANADGYVEYPNVDTVTEMTNLIDSSRSYEASATAFNAAKNIAAKGLELFNS